MAQSVTHKPDETAVMVTYAAVFLVLWYFIVRLARAVVCAVWPIYIIAAIGTVKLMQVYKPEELLQYVEQYYKTISDVIMKEYHKYAPYLGAAKK